MSRKYDDIIGLPRPVSKKHKPMPRQMRAAQFAPYAALVGFGAAVEETARTREASYDFEAFYEISGEDPEN